jgi:hypothetical protein
MIEITLNSDKDLRKVMTQCRFKILSRESEESLAPKPLSMVELFGRLSEDPVWGTPLLDPDPLLPYKDQVEIVVNENMGRFALRLQAFDHDLRICTALGLFLKAILKEGATSQSALDEAREQVKTDNVLFNLVSVLHSAWTVTMVTLGRIDREHPPESDEKDLLRILDLVFSLFGLPTYIRITKWHMAAFNTVFNRLTAPCMDQIKGKQLRDPHDQILTLRGEDESKVALNLTTDDIGVIRNHLKDLGLPINFHRENMTAVFDGIRIGPFVSLLISSGPPGATENIYSEVVRGLGFKTDIPILTCEESQVARFDVLTTVSMRKFSPKNFLKTLQDPKIKLIELVNAIITALLSVGGDQGAACRADVVLGNLRSESARVMRLSAQVEQRKSQLAPKQQIFILKRLGVDCPNIAHLSPLMDDTSPVGPIGFNPDEAADIDSIDLRLVFTRFLICLSFNTTLDQPTAIDGIRILLALLCFRSSDEAEPPKLGDLRHFAKLIPAIHELLQKQLSDLVTQRERVLARRSLLSIKLGALSYFDSAHMQMRLSFPNLPESSEKWTSEQWYTFIDAAFKAYKLKDNMQENILVEKLILDILRMICSKESPEFYGKANFQRLIAGYSPDNADSVPVATIIVDVTREAKEVLRRLLLQLFPPEKPLNFDVFKKS